MSLEAAIINFKKAIKEKKAKNYVKFKFIIYTKEYDKIPELDVIHKATHRDLFESYCKYMSASKEDK